MKTEVFGFKKIFTIAFITWIFMVMLGFNFIHTFVLPVVLIIALIPLSGERFVSHFLYRLIMSIWLAIVIPTSYISIRWALGLNSHCDRASIIAGQICFFTFMLKWIVELNRQKCYQLQNKN